MFHSVSLRWTLVDFWTLYACALTIHGEHVRETMMLSVGGVLSQSTIYKDCGSGARETPG